MSQPLLPLAPAFMRIIEIDYFPPLVSTGDSSSTDCILECRTKGGIASLCGFEENTGFASTPPKKYKTVTYSGSLFGCYSDVGACAHATAGYQQTISGSSTMGRGFGGMCEVQTLGTSVFNSANNLCPPPAVNPPQDFGGNGLVIGPPLSSGVVANISSATQQSLDGVGCALYEGGPSTINVTGTNSYTLSNEDTEEDAIAALLANEDWSDWMDSCTGAYEQRTDGFDFQYTALEWRISASGLIPSTLYTASVDYYQRAYGSADEWVLADRNSNTGTSDGSGELQIIGPPAESFTFQPGFEYQVRPHSCPQIVA